MVKPDLSSLHVCFPSLVWIIIFSLQKYKCVCYRTLPQAPLGVFHNMQSMHQITFITGKIMNTEAYQMQGLPVCCTAAPKVYRFACLLASWTPCWPPGAMMACLTRPHPCCGFAAATCVSSSNTPCVWHWPPLTWWFLLPRFPVASQAHIAPLLPPALTQWDFRKYFMYLLG